MNEVVREECAIKVFELLLRGRITSVFEGSSAAQVCFHPHHSVRNEKIIGSIPIPGTIHCCYDGLIRGRPSNSPVGQMLHVRYPPISLVVGLDCTMRLTIRSALCLWGRIWHWGSLKILS